MINHNRSRIDLIETDNSSNKQNVFNSQKKECCGPESNRQPIDL